MKKESIKKNSQYQNVYKNGVYDFTFEKRFIIIDKFDKTKLALEYGVDLVVELPFIFATQAADIYAYGAVKAF